MWKSKQSNYFDCSSSFSEHCQTINLHLTKSCKVKDCKNRNDDCVDSTDCSSDTTCLNEDKDYRRINKKCFFTDVDRNDPCYDSVECVRFICNDGKCLNDESLQVNDTCYDNSECSVGLICYNVCHNPTWQQVSNCLIPMKFVWTC